MLEQIHIQNFRCFEDFKAEGFERVNLIGGKNNSGKSCLLEAILCLRKEENKSTYLLEIAQLRSESYDDIFYENLRVGNNIEGTLAVYANYGKLEENPKYSYSTDYSKSQSSAWLKSNLDIFYISQTKSLPAINFYDVFYKIELEDKTDEFIKILNKIDSSITKIRTIGKDGITPKIKQTFNRNHLKITSFGDATNSLLRYFTPIIEKLVFPNENQNEFILLIDEIENGIHYTAHEEFWQHIFKLSKELNVQVFATTHSLEMIKAFNAVALKEGEGAYFEMLRNENTNEIKALKHSTAVLEEELETNEKIRGEMFKEKIILTKELIDILNEATKDAQNNLRASNIPVPFIKDGWIWQTMPNGEEVKYKKLEPLKQTNATA